jgi:putative phosphoribosyl transferase
MFLFQDRQDAGRELAQLLRIENIKAPLLLALPKGGVAVAHEISDELGIPFDVLVTREVGYPGHEDIGIGAISENERAFITDEVNLADPRMLELINEERSEIRRIVALYRQGNELPIVAGRNIVLVDDGMTDGVLALAAAKFLKEQGAEKVMLAVPIAPIEEADYLWKYIDNIICPHRVLNLVSVGEYFNEFNELTDGQVLELLGREVD